MIFSAMALLVSFAACQPEKNPEGQTPGGSVDPGASTDPTVSEDPGAPKSTECRLTSFVIKTDLFTLDGFVDQTDKSVEISYMPNEYEFLSAAVAEVEISEKATITPDPTTPIDYTVSEGVTFTVTAEDGETKTEYHVYLAAAEFSERAEKRWEKTYGELKIAAKPNFDCGIAFCDTEHFVYADLNVFDLDGNKVGTLNTDGVTGLEVYADGKVAATGQLAAMTNDDNGVLVAITSFTGEYVEGGSGCKTEVYAWKDGWDKAPTKVYGPVDYQCMYMSASGEVEGDFVLNFRTGANNPQMHHVLVFHGGKFFNEDGSSAATWYGPMIEHPGNDGCWGQMLSFFSGDPEEGFVVWDSLAAAEYGMTGNASAAFYVYNEGLQAFVNQAAVELQLFGQVNWTNWDSEGGMFSYGNYSTGHVRAFKYNGLKYIIAATSSWPNTWITIQKAEEVAYDDEETEEVDESAANYLLPTVRVEDTAQCRPCSAYVYDPATGTGHVVYAAQNAKVLAFDLITDRL